MNHRKTFPHRPALLVVPVFLAAFAGCASMPPAPTPSMTRAEVEIEQARKAGAEQSASESLRQAQEKLAEAKTAAGHDNERSAALVDEAFADARLADLTAQASTAAKAAAEADRSIHALETEANHPVSR
jgi:hypothetical protein